jgi:hypothetical protein
MHTYHAIAGVRGGGLVTGGRDGRVLLWDAQLQLTHTFDLTAAAAPDAPLKCDVRSVASQSGKVTVLPLL